jgi:hypothetical protein
MTYLKRAKRATLAEYNLEKLEDQIGALQYDLQQAVSIHEQEEIERKIAELQAQYRMIVNSMDL